MSQEKPGSSRAASNRVLVLLDKEYTRQQPTQPWEQYYVDRIADHFTS